MAAESAVEQSLDLNRLLHLEVAEVMRVLLLETLLVALRRQEEMLGASSDVEELVLTE